MILSHLTHFWLGNILAEMLNLFFKLEFANYLLILQFTAIFLKVGKSESANRQSEINIWRDV